MVTVGMGVSFDSFVSNAKLCLTKVAHKAHAHVHPQVLLLVFRLSQLAFQNADQRHLTFRAVVRECAFWGT
jgi:hypothetical protein